VRRAEAIGLDEADLGLLDRCRNLGGGEQLEERGAATAGPGGGVSEPRLEL
jgi:hypothetical protein